MFDVVCFPQKKGGIIEKGFQKYYRPNTFHSVEIPKIFLTRLQAPPEKHTFSFHDNRFSFPTDASSLDQGFGSKRRVVHKSQIQNAFRDPISGKRFAYIDKLLQDNHDHLPSVRQERTQFVDNNNYSSLRDVKSTYRFDFIEQINSTRNGTATATTVVVPSIAKDNDWTGLNPIHSNVRRCKSSMPVSKSVQACLQWR